MYLFFLIVYFTIWSCTFSLNLVIEWVMRNVWRYFTNNVLLHIFELNKLGLNMMHRMKCVVSFIIQWTNYTSLLKGFTNLFSCLLGTNIEATIVSIYTSAYSLQNVSQRPSTCRLKLTRPKTTLLFFLDKLISIPRCSDNIILNYNIQLFSQ